MNHKDHFLQNVGGCLVFRSEGNATGKEMKNLENIYVYLVVLFF